MIPRIRTRPMYREEGGGSVSMLSLSLLFFMKFFLSFVLFLVNDVEIFLDENCRTMALFYIVFNLLFLYTRSETYLSLFEISKVFQKNREKQTKTLFLLFLFLFLFTKIISNFYNFCIKQEFPGKRETKV